MNEPTADVIQTKVAAVHYDRVSRGSHTEIQPMFVRAVSS